MKTTIDKSKVMKRAWSIFRGCNPYSYRFSESLRRAWEVEKAEIAYAAEKAAKAAELAEMAARAAAYREAHKNDAPREMGEAYNAGVAAYYAAGSNGRTYFGD